MKKCMISLCALLMLTACATPETTTVEDEPAEIMIGDSADDTETLEGQEEPDSSQATNPDSITSDLTGLDIDTFFEDSFRMIMLRTPESVVENGLTEIYGMETVELNNISDAYLRETYAIYAMVLGTLHTYDRDSLTPEQQVSYDVYEWWLMDMIDGQEFIYYDYPATFFFVNSVPGLTENFFTEIHPLETADDARDYITRLGLIETKFDQLIDNLTLHEEAGVVPPRWVFNWTLGGLRQTANGSAVDTLYYLNLLDGLQGMDDLSQNERSALLDEAEAVIAGSVQPAYQALIEKLNAEQNLASDDDGVWQFENGSAYYQYTIQHHATSNMTPDEIHDLGLRELDRIHAEMRVIFDDLGYPADADLVTLYNMVGRDGGMVSGGALISTYEEIIDSAYANLGSAFDIFPEAEVIVIGGPTGGYYIPASLDGSRPGAFYANTNASALPYFNMPSLTYHEAVPGHHLQIAIAQEMDLPTFRNVVFFSGYTEGWGLYAERLASDLGWYADDPYGELGRLQYEAFRAARLVVDTGLHDKGWTFDQSVEFFVENTGFGEGMAQGQIARYVVWPGQSTSYMIGLLTFLDLREQAQTELGDNFDLIEFHRVVLGNGSMPLEILEDVVADYIMEKRGE